MPFQKCVLIPSEYYEKNVKYKIETNKTIMGRKNTDKQKPIKKKSNVQRSKQMGKKKLIRYVLNQMAKKRKTNSPH